MGVSPGIGFVMPGGQRSRLVHACCLRHSHSLRRVSYPPWQTWEKRQGVPASVCSASSQTAEACGTLQIAMYRVTAIGRFPYGPRKIAAIAVLMIIQAICQVSNLTKFYHRFEVVVVAVDPCSPARSRWGIE